MGRSLRLALILALGALGLFLYSHRTTEFTRSPAAAANPGSRAGDSAVSNNSKTLVSGIAKAGKPKIFEGPDFLAMAESLGSPTPDPQAKEDKVQAMASGLSSSDAEELTRFALDENKTHNGRFLAVYLLSQRPDDFARQLEKIACSPSSELTAKVAPHTMGEIQQHAEQTVRIQALSALDSRSTRTSEEGNFCQQCANSSELGPMLRKFAALCALGAAKRVPQIEQFINTMGKGRG